MIKTDKSEPIKLLWTGGSDSSFRMLEIVLIEKRQVQPYYFIAPQHRKSVRNEQEAQRKIKQALFKKYPEAKALVLSTIYVHTSDIPQDEEIAQANREAQAIRAMGRQYEFIARYAKQQGFFDMELCIEASNNPDWVERYFIFMERVGETRMLRYSLKFKERPEYHIFKYFNFPMSELAKRDMYEIAKERGWWDILKYTWFCHTPYLGRIPCGVCVPCRQAIGEGMGWRIPFYTRYLYKIWDKKAVLVIRRVLNPRKRKSTRLHS